MYTPEIGKLIHACIEQYTNINLKKKNPVNQQNSTTSISSIKESQPTHLLKIH
jgi:hypothetical protein